MGEAETAAAEMPAADDASEALVRGLRQADPNAHAQLCEQFGPPLHRYLARRLHDTQLAEELMIQALVDAVRTISRFTARRSVFSAWLFGIARRQLGLELRRQRRRKAIPPSAQVSIEAIREQADPGDMAATLTARIEAQRQVAKLKSALSRLEMEVLTLHCLDQLSLKEIAQLLGRTERAIDSLLHRARQKARERLAQDD
jgi:RNA polymerase sigma-70 factor (ECF subfamily)